MRINGITYGKLKTQLQVNGNLNAYARVTLVRGNFGKCLDCGAGAGGGYGGLFGSKLNIKLCCSNALNSMQVQI